jgi:uncharacterized membrane protein
MNDPVDDIQNYKWNIFYYNREDTRIIVPKRVRVFGWSLNFARKESYLVLVIIMEVIVLLSKLNG